MSIGPHLSEHESRKLCQILERNLSWLQYTHMSWAGVPADISQRLRPNETTGVPVKLTRPNGEDDGK